MSIRIGNSCGNCDNLTNNHQCGVHEVQVSESYTCDSFEMKVALKNDPNCSSCSRFEKASCANPQKAAAGMLCSKWAPENAQA